MQGSDEILSFVLRMLRVCDGFRGPGPDELFWRTDGDYAPITFFVNCNDVFFWGCADLEKVTSENIHVLEESISDLYSIDEYGGAMCGAMLFCSRVRKMRPQGAIYKHIDPKYQHLFDACGPEREVGAGNPHSQKSYAGSGD